MAYEPIQMPSGPAGAAFFDALHQAQEEKRQRRTDAWNQMIQQGVSNRAQQELDLRKQQEAFRQQQITQQNQEADQERNARIAEHLQSLHESGLSHEAQQLAGIYGFHGTEDTGATGPRVGQLYDQGDLGAHARQELSGPAAPTPFQPVDIPPRPEFVGPIDTPEHASLAARESLLTGSATTSPEGVAAAGDAAAAEATRLQAERDQYASALATRDQHVRDYATQLLGSRQEAPAAPGPVGGGADPIAQAQAQYQEHPMFRYTGPGGISFDIDPRERLHAALAENQRRAEQFKAAFQGDPGMAPYAGEFAARAQLGEEPKAIFGDLRARQLADAEAKRKAAGEPAHSAGRFEQEKELARIRAAAAAAGNGAGPTPVGLADLIGMKEAGLPDSEIAAAAAKARIPTKIWTPAVKEVIRGAAIGDRAKEKREQLRLTGPNGEDLGFAHNLRDAGTVSKSNAAFVQLQNRLHALIADIDSHGDRVLSPADIQRRESFIASAAAAGRVYNGLGATDASQRMEQEILGPAGTPGHQLLMGANSEVVRNVLHEAELSHRARIGIYSRGAGAQNPLPPSLGGQRAPAGGATKTLRMPDGSTAVFDVATGKRIQ